MDAFFEVNKDGRTSGHTLKLAKHRSNKDLRHHIFSERVVNRWNQLDKDTVEASSLNSFKNWLAKLRLMRICFLWTSVCIFLWLDQVLHLVQPHQVYEYDQVYDQTLHQWEPPQPPTVQHQHYYSHSHTGNGPGTDRQLQ